jgi:predicted glycoside hydrolase/deacetylase ChbG (UPF0249 family)
MAAVARVAAEFGIHAARKPYEDLRTLLGKNGDNSGKRSDRGRSLTALAAGMGRAGFLRRARASGLRTPDHFCGFAWTGDLTAERLVRWLDRLPDGTTELMCHPGHNDEELAGKATRLKRERELELEALTAPEVRQAVERRGIRLAHFGDMAEAHV